MVAKYTHLTSNFLRATIHGQIESAYKDREDKPGENS